MEGNTNTLTGVYMCTNVDGVHVKEELIGYIDQHPFIVLSEFIGRYYIYGYCDDILYPAHVVGYNNFIYIKNEGFSYSYKNFTKNKVKDISIFCAMYKDDLKSTALNNAHTDEYFGIIKVCLDNGNTDLQYALDLKLKDYSNIDTNDPRYSLRQYYEWYESAKVEIDEYYERLEKKNGEGENSNEE